MIYCAPANAADEVSALAAAGAGELYCGVQEQRWQERYGNHDSISRRQGRANLSTRAELAQLVEASHTRGLPVYLALNGHYDEEQLDYLMELCVAFERMGGTGVIVRDLGLLWRLHEEGSELARVLSLLAACANAQSARAYASLGVTRIVFPRFMDAYAVGKVLRSVPNIEAESMVFFDKCPLVDGYCNHYHGVGYAPRMGKDAELPGEPLYTFCTTYTTHACLGKSCTYVNPDPCGACEVAAFERVGVRYGKLGGRGRPLAERVRALEFLRAAEKCESDEARARLYQRTFGHPCSCYYGEATQSQRAIEDPRATFDPARTYVGSQTNADVFAHALESFDGTVKSTTLLVPPLCGEELTQELVEEVCQRMVGARVCVNDVGTLAAFSMHGEVELTAGSLLVGGGVPVELESFLSPETNPPRAIWDADGNPRVLTYRRPSPELLDHWMHGLSLEARPSLRAALAFIAGGRQVAQET